MLANAMLPRPMPDPVRKFLRVLFVGKKAIAGASVKAESISRSKAPALERHALEAPASSDTNSHGLKSSIHCA